MILFHQCDGKMSSNHGDCSERDSIAVDLGWKFAMCVPHDLLVNTCCEELLGSLWDVFWPQNSTGPARNVHVIGFEEKTGCPVLVNTSFNVRGEPVVCTPDDAYRCFVNTEMDYLAIGNFLLERKAQPTEGVKQKFHPVPD